MDTTPPPMPPSDSATPPPVVSTTEDKTVAILSYITLFGFIAAVVIHSNKKTQLGAFHLRQTLGFFITGFAAIILVVIPILGLLLLPLFGLAMFVLWLLGLLSAVKGEMKPMPFVGPLYQKWFGNAFN
jgi:uncharacterized membrane protein